MPRYSKSPVYPVEIEGSGLDGRAELVFIVDADGTVREPNVRSATHPAFGSAAMEVIEAWRFKPGIRDGRVVSMRVAQPFRFYAGPTRRANAALGRVVFEDIEDLIYSPVEVGGLPEIVYSPVAPYPRNLLGSGRSEVVFVTMVVGPDGRGYNIEIEGYPQKEFIVVAVVTASAYLFVPVLRDGKGVYVYTRVPIVIAEDEEGRKRVYDDQVGGASDIYADYPDEW